MKKAIKIIWFNFASVIAVLWIIGYAAELLGKLKK